MMLCEYGCGRKAEFKMKNGKLCCSEYYCQCSEVRNKSSKSKKGKPSHWKGKKRGPDSEETRKKKSEYNKGKKPSDLCLQKAAESRRGSIPWNKGKIIGPHTQEWKDKISKKLKGNCSKENREKYRQFMLSGHAVYMNKCIKNPSKPELILREMIMELYPNCEFQYKVLNYALDVAIPEYKIAIEYDGWFHFDCQEHIDYHKNRQSEIENEGWKFIKYNIFQKFPTIEQIENDIKDIK